MSIINDNETPKHPLPADGVGTCEQCRWWLARNKMRVVPQAGGGVVPVKELIMQGQSPKTADVITISHCTEAPIWAQVTDDHWCGRWHAIVPDELQ